MKNAETDESNPEPAAEEKKEETEKLVLQWEVLSGSDAEPVVALPDKAGAFDCWSDGLTTPYRMDKNVSGDIRVYAIFKEAKEDDMEKIGEDDADDLPHDLMDRREAVGEIIRMQTTEATTP